METITCRACGEVYERRDIRCPKCGTVTRADAPDGGGTCRSCRLFAGVSVALLVFWLYVFLTRSP